MKNLKILSIGSCLLIGFLFISCGSTPAPTATPSSISEDGWVTYTVDDPQKCGCFYTSGELGKYSMLEAEFKKSSGYEDSCFGFVFGYAKQRFGVVSNYIRFEINTLGECAVYKYDGSTYTDLLDSSAKNTAYLETNSSIKKGYDSVNTLKVEKSEEGTYSLYINGTKLISDVKPVEKGTNGFMTFYSVGKDFQENFPEVPVEIAFKVTDFTLVEGK